MKDKKINIGHHFCNPPFTQIGSDYIASVDPASDNPDVTIMKVYSDKVTGVDGVAIGKPVFGTMGHESTGIGISALEYYAEKNILGGCNNVIMGLDAGLDFTTESNKVIIGDNIRSMDKTQPNVLFIGDHVAIGKTLFGKPINLFDVITEYYNATRNQESL
jgi:hypothetical protein